MDFGSINIVNIIIGLLFFLVFFVLCFFLFKRSTNINKKYGSIGIFVSIVFFIIAFFQPRYGSEQQDLEVRGVDFVVLLDVSKSMEVADIKYQNQKISRLDMAKQMISKFIVKHTNDRFALVVFANDTTSICPLTLDKNIFLTFLAGVNNQNVLSQGTNLELALEQGINRFDKESKRAKIILLFSDGGDEAVNLSNIAQVIKDNGIYLTTIGVGTKQGGKIIEGKSVRGDTIYKKHNGKVVISKLFDDNLIDIVKKTNGEYIHLKNGNSLNKIDKTYKDLKKESLKIAKTGEKQDISSIFVFIGLVIFLISLSWFNLYWKIKK